jgi:hypothetical protein
VRLRAKKSPSRRKISVRQGQADLAAQSAPCAQHSSQPDDNQGWNGSYDKAHPDCNMDRANLPGLIIFHFHILFIQLPWFNKLLIVHLLRIGVIHIS